TSVQASAPPSECEKGAGYRWVCPASLGVPHPQEGWQACPGIGGSFAVESAAAFAWNRWQVYYGISGSFRVERVAALPWNQWQDSPGIGGSFAVEYALKGLLDLIAAGDRRQVADADGFPGRLRRGAEGHGEQQHGADRGQARAAPPQRAP